MDKSYVPEQEGAVPMETPKKVSTEITIKFDGEVSKDDKRFIVDHIALYLISNTEYTGSVTCGDKKNPFWPHKCEGCNGS